MAKIELTVRQIINLGLWGKVCEYKDWNPYILREGKIDENDLVEFDDEFKIEEDDGIEISLIEAINILKQDEGEFKVTYEDGRIEFIDKYDDLGGCSFNKLFKAKFYKDYQ